MLLINRTVRYNLNQPVLRELRVSPGYIMKSVSDKYKNIQDVESDHAASSPY